MAQLTERQQEIKDLLEQGKKAEEIGKKLKITTNAVYQQIRRMRAGGARVSTPTGKGGKGSAKGKGGKGRAKPQLTPSAPAAPAAAPAAPVHMTPLASVRARRDEINAHTRKAAQEVEAAQRALDAAKAQTEKVEARFKDELKSLDKAEAVLRPQPAAPAKPAAAKKSTAKKRTTPKPAAAAPAAPAAPAPPAPAPAAPADPQASANGTGAASAPESAPQPPQEAPATA